MKSITPPKSLSGSLILPADKSISHRAAMFAAVHDGVSRIEGYSEAADPQSTLHCLDQLGVPVGYEGETLVIKGIGRSGWSVDSTMKTLDCGNSGTTMRLLAGLLGGAGAHVCLEGDESLSARPMQRILDPLNEMGIQIKGDHNNQAPLCITPGYEIKPLHFPLPIPSAQLKSCVLLAGLFADQTTTVVEYLPSRDHTERMLELPVKIENDKRIIEAHNQISVPNQSGRIPGDFSAAAFWMVAGSIQKAAEITLESVGLNPTRTGALDVLHRMGAHIEVEEQSQGGREPRGVMHIGNSNLQAVQISEEEIPNCIDELPVLAVAMAFADGESRVEGAGELRVKETDRLDAIADMLSAAKVEFEMWDDGFAISGNPTHQFPSTTFKSYGDHRIAMAAAVLSTKSNGSCQIEDAECIRISYPSFFEHYEQLSG